MARDGWLFVGPALVVCLVGWLMWRAGHSVTGITILIIGAFATLAFAYFFRDPDRQSPNDPNALIATADGRIVSVTTLPDGRTSIHTFLSVMDVHVNRAPVSGRVSKSIHSPGKFELAWKDDAGHANERHDLVIESSHGPIHSTQIAGILARRIICRPKVGDIVVQGQRIGMIRFGSRAEVVAPVGFEVRVKIGDRVRAGETVLAQFGGGKL